MNKKLENINIIKQLENFFKKMRKNLTLKWYFYLVRRQAVSRLKIRT